MSTDRDLKYPEIFDRSVNTLAATYPKYGDVAYNSPVQRIGSFMDNTARLKKKHLLEIITLMKTQIVTSRHLSDKEDKLTGDTPSIQKSYNEYLEHCLFIGVMPEEDRKSTL